MLLEPNWQEQFSTSLKSIARREDIKAYIAGNPLFHRVLQRAAEQYVTGENRRDGIEAAIRLDAQGYAVSLEYIGENTVSEEECKAAASELSALIDELAGRGLPSRVSFDLSHIGLSLDAELAARHLLSLAETARQAGIELFVSMEESEKTERILAVYERCVALCPNIGITLQAHLQRTKEDLLTRLPAGARVRIVKGAYREEDSIPRSQSLNERYLELVELAANQGHRVSIATHDESLIDHILQGPLAEKRNIEFEMLYGVRPELGSRLKKAGYPVRIYLTYGKEWYLYLCHRIAEHPPNVYRAVTAMIDGEIAAPVYE